jgi:hypothetical protein
LVMTACGDDTASTTTTVRRSTTTSSTTASTTTGATTSVPAGQGVVWPPVGSTTTYDDPVQAATAFAVQLVGFVEPVVGPFRQGDSRSGEVDVRPKASGPVTTVLVRQVGSGPAWSVIGAGTADIRPTAPAASSVVSSPVHLAGTSTAFEGTVQVAVHDRSGGKALGTGYVTGGSMGELRPYSSDLAFTTPATTDGSVVLWQLSMEDGRVTEAAVVPVRFPG